jgi:YggT family protein
MQLTPLFLINAIIDLLQILILAYVVISWIPSLRRYPLAIWVERTVDPWMRPLRRLLPLSAGGVGLDLSPLIAFLLLGILRSLLSNILR